MGSEIMAQSGDAGRKSGAVGGPEQCDLLVRHGHILTMDSKRTVYPDGAIAVRGTRIVAVGPTAALAGRLKPRRVIDAGGAAVHPGFIDGHYHAGLHLSRGSITDNPNPPKEEGGGGPGAFTRWINALTDEDEYASALMASVEMVRNGFTGYVEAATAFAPEMIVEAAEAVGIRVSVTDCMLWDVLGGEPMAAEIPRAPCDARRARRLLGEQLKRRRNADGLVRAHVALYGIGSGSEELIQEAKRLADENRVVFHQHQNFMPSDAAYDRQRFGRPALVHLAEKDILGPNVVFTHMNALEDAEVDAVAESGMALVWHPGNFMYYAIAQQVRSRFPELHRRGSSITFGTDVAKVWAFGDLGFVGYLVSREWGEFVSSEALLEMFTLGGARALGMADEVGSLEAGKRADLVIRSNDLPDAQPNLNIVKQLMLVSRTKSVDTVICNGDVVVRHGLLTKLDERAVYALARESALRMGERAGIKPSSPWPSIA
jgi:cytosine/adenosine deaminase-related metal-dependent hydrolase